MSDHWPLPDDVSCPECGEDTHIAGTTEKMRRQVDPVTSEFEEVVVEAALVCGVSFHSPVASGCGHTWTWRRGENDE